jgi:hypothetical protein
MRLTEATPSAEEKQERLDEEAMWQRKHPGKYDAYVDRYQQSLTGPKLNIFDFELRDSAQELALAVTEAIKQGTITCRDKIHWIHPL